MSPKPKLSEKNIYWVEKHRFYELKHFCRQYPIWKKAYLSLDGYTNRLMTEIPTKSKDGHPVEKCVEAREWYYDRMLMIEKTAVDTDTALSAYIIRGVTEGLSYDVIKVQYNIPCCRDVYYRMYRRFFWLLNNVRQ
ncbi:MAG: hypothetical protein R3Y12_04310 [Clostridia bacterium]